MLALTGKRKDSSNPGFFVQSLVLLVSGLQKRGETFDSQNSQPSKKLVSEVLFFKKEMMKQSKYSLKTGLSFLLSHQVLCVSQRCFCNSSSSSRLSCLLAWARGATTHQGQTGNSRRGRAEQKQLLPVHRQWKPQTFCCFFALCAG